MWEESGGHGQSSTLQFLQLLEFWGDPAPMAGILAFLEFLCISADFRGVIFLLKLSGGCSVIGNEQPQLTH